MSACHTTYSQCEVVFEGETGSVTGFDYLAVVCMKCGLEAKEVDVAASEAPSGQVAVS